FRVAPAPVISSLSLHDALPIFDAGRVAGLDLGGADAARGVGDVDGVLADALAELAQAARRAARADDRGLELGESLAVFLGDDRGEGEHGGRAGDLDGVARLGKGSAGLERESDRRSRHGEEELVHWSLLLFGKTVDALASGAAIKGLCNSWMTNSCRADYGLIPGMEFLSLLTLSRPAAAALRRG